MGYVENDVKMIAIYKLAFSLENLKHSTNLVKVWLKLLSYQENFIYFLNCFLTFFFILKTVDEWQYSCFALGCLQFTFFSGTKLKFYLIQCI